MEGTHEIAISEDVWVPGDTSIVGIASKIYMKITKIYTMQFAKHLMKLCSM